MADGELFQITLQAADVSEGEPNLEKKDMGGAT